ncbi:hypothetical protein G6F57_009656 [Rhizopus arrhizus]|nr:hypothetical protein G6F23_005203 [Rhizopus arrhizus]KAG1413976.1 hypothetical protein G6F58_007191 [Rhizopus delemar]KAG0761429.1 hypothetical protein G6F24_007571 [Rhizopus arrhizus]KAG0793863.1 hypothetical protein G6F21_003290 [Rhizopus arrhizus]KAG0798904.1 hypothetical protein G6F22_003757 [Rhizopus arrhizus]
MSIPQPNHHYPVEEEYQKTVLVENPPTMAYPPPPGCVQPGMGPNLVFHFPPYATPQPPVLPPSGPLVIKKEVEIKGPKETYLVQGDPTWSRPRMPVRKGQRLRNEGCVIQ